MSVGCTPGALCIAGFTQARAPHIGLLLVTTEAEGTLFHIHIDRSIQPNWHFQRRREPLAGNMFLSSLMHIRNDPLSLDDAEDLLTEAAKSIPPPENDDFGECAPWVFRVLDALATRGVLTVVDREKLEEEVDSFARCSRAFARRDKLPNISVSQFCH
ncbi:hypothetical protein BKA70DRAFT_1183155 [Coprinopsis sp. MPI-PUGE-AT-0042]|nr:hypothetical protein BKA70DRAFT_1183155 [Coprinopsis sp. MPI-PUGE-AT-0042]